MKNRSEKEESEKEKSETEGETQKIHVPVYILVIFLGANKPETKQAHPITATDILNESTVALFCSLSLFLYLKRTRI
jgi:hypothetical protein